MKKNLKMNKMKYLMTCLLAVCLLSPGAIAQDGKTLPVLNGNILTYNGQNLDLTAGMVSITLIGWSLPSSDIIVAEGTTEAQIGACRAALEKAGYAEIRIMTKEAFAAEKAAEKTAESGSPADAEADAAEMEQAVSAPVEGTIYDSVEVLPSLKNGEDFARWVAAHLKYPKEALEGGYQGRVMVRFVVTETGRVRQVKVLRGVEPSLDREAVRVISSSSGKWNPGTRDGKPVNTRYMIPVVFRPD
ncbi:MAG: energy transducer TonB [Bacteroidales bacterium]|nr:energy transducer TonB [Bacteroidales bacterium]